MSKYRKEVIVSQNSTRVCHENNDVLIVRVDQNSKRGYIYHVLFKGKFLGRIIHPDSRNWCFRLSPERITANLPGTAMLEIAGFLTGLDSVSALGEKQSAGYDSNICPTCGSSSCLCQFNPEL